jgi:hypothetical protein
MTTSWKALGSPVLTPEIQKKLVDGVHAEVGSRTIEELEAERDEILLGLLRTKRPEASSSRRRSDGIGVATRHGACSERIARSAGRRVRGSIRKCDHSRSQACLADSAR